MDARHLAAGNLHCAAHTAGPALWRCSAGRGCTCRSLADLSRSGASAAPTPCRRAPSPCLLCPQGWAGGMVVLVVAGLATAYFNVLLAGLFEFGGMRNTTYRDLAHHVMGGSCKAGDCGWSRPGCETAMPPCPLLGAAERCKRRCAHWNLHAAHQRRRVPTLLPRPSGRCWAPGCRPAPPVCLPLCADLPVCCHHRGRYCKPDPGGAVPAVHLCAVLRRCATVRCPAKAWRD